MELLGFEIHTSQLDVIDLNKKICINTINPHSYCVAQEDDLFRDALLSSDILLPDGVGIVWAAKILQKKKIKRCAGYDVFIRLLEDLNRENGSCFFLGSSEETLKSIKDRLSLEYPNIVVGTYSPPYRDYFTREDNENMVRSINSFIPDVLFVGMTAPKQEKWVYLNYDFINSNVICSIGAVFDFYAGNVKRAPRFIINLGLEWLYRSFSSWRLAKRNLLSNPKFLVYVLKYRILKK